MKGLNVLFLCLMSVPGFAQDVDGSWDLVSRVCKSGVAAHDGFDSKTGYARLIVSKTDAVLALDFGTGRDRMVVKGTLVVEGSKLAFVATAQVLNTTPNLPMVGLGQALLSPNRNRFSFEASGFGRGGTCPEGDTLVTTFRRR